MNKKGQGISINVIIIAVLALVVLVVLVAIFTGRIGLFEKGVSKEANAKLTSLRIQYGDCHPAREQEQAFAKEYSDASKLESETAREAAQGTAEDSFRAEMNNCKVNGDKSGCVSTGCKWG